MVPSPPRVAVGPSWDLFSSLFVFSALTPLALSIFSSLTTFLSCLTQHSSHTTLISHNTYLRYLHTILWLFASFFFKKSLKHIRKSYVFFFFSVNIVINLFVVVINLFVSVLWLFAFFFFEINIMINYKKCNHLHSITHVMSKKLVISCNWFCNWFCSV